MLGTKQSVGIVLLVAVGVVVGCTTYQYNEYGAKEPEKYFGTQPGYHELSEYFSVEVSDRLMKFYFQGNSKNDKKLIGTIRTFWFDLSNYGPREIAYAISSDGKRILFFDEPGVDEDKPANTAHGYLVANLYVLDTESGQKHLLYPNVHRLSINCVDLPINYIRFGKFTSTSTIEQFAYSTDGNEVSLEERRKRLFDGGRKEAICGPL